MKNMLSVAFCLIMTVACSVKENRQLCPCRLVLDLSEIDTSKVKMVNVLAVSSGNIVFSDSVHAEDFRALYERKVSHEEMRVMLWGVESGDDRLLIPYGCESPSYHMYAFDADTSGEVCRETVGLWKNFCRMTVLFEGRDDIPYRLTFRGNVDGYGIDGLPSDGVFSCVAYPSGDGSSQVVLPRQMDSSLLLDVEDEDSRITKTFAIGEYMSKSGYDWTSENLKDATVILDYHVTGISITFKGWDEEYIYDIIL